MNRRTSTNLTFLFFFTALAACAPTPPVPDLEGSDDLKQSSAAANNGNEIALPGAQKPVPSNISQLARETNAVLPYQINFDTMLSMTCPGDAKVNDSVFHTFKLGAYLSGLQLNPKFKLKGSTADKKAKLKAADLIGARAQLSLSKTGAPESMAEIRKGTPIVNLLDLKHSSVIDKLAEKGISYRLAGRSSVELALPYPGNSLQNLVPLLNSRLSVYLTYNAGTDQRPLKKGDKYYGRQFKFGFSGNNNYVSQMSEIDLARDESAGRWRCPEKFRFAVHRDPTWTRELYKANRGFFDRHDLSAEWECQEDASVLSAEERKLFDVLDKQRTLVFGKTVKWTKDANGTNQPTLLNQRCVRPKNSGHHCYNNREVKRVEFDESECVAGGRDSARLCPAYLSLCARQMSSRSN